MRIKLLAIILSIIFFFLVLELIRRKKLTFRFAVSWLIVSISGVIFTLFENFLFRIAGFLGFILPSNFIFFVIGVIFVLLSLILTVYLCQQNSRLELIAQKIGIIEEELVKLKKDKPC